MTARTRATTTPPVTVAGRRWLKVNRKRQELVIDLLQVPNGYGRGVSRADAVSLLDVLIAMNLTDHGVEQLLAEYTARHIGYAQAEREKVTQAVRRLIGREAGHVCHWCRRAGTPQRGPDGKWWAIDHVMPISRGGDSRRENLVLACFSCNSEKGAQHPDDWRRMLDVRSARRWLEVDA